MVTLKFDGSAGPQDRSRTELIARLTILASEAKASVHTGSCGITILLILPDMPKAYVGGNVRSFPH